MTIELRVLHMMANNYRSFVHLHDSESKLHSEGGRILFPNPSDSIVSLPEIPPYPEPLHEWYDSPQVTETLEAFDIHLSQFWTERIEELNY